MNNKTCQDCNSAKSLDDFYKHPQTADRRQPLCKECHKKKSKKNRDDNIERARSYDRTRGQTTERKAAYADKQRRMRSEKGPEYMAAHSAVARAIKIGALIRPDHCSVCLVHGAPQAHHDDHSKKLDVMWLCPICHAARHMELKKMRDVKPF